jgi:hypothetical protein
MVLKDCWKSTSIATWGGGVVVLAFNVSQQEYIAHFSKHPVIGLECNPKNNALMAVLSTENLFLNV